MNVKLISGYDRTKTPELITFEVMTLEQARTLEYGDQVWFRDTQGKARQAKVNGKPKTWKRDRTRIEIPLKYGLYEFARFDSSDIANNRLLTYVGTNPR